MEVLTALQEEFINAFANTALKDLFFLTGGTALSAFYLQHRLSEDVDFFTEDEGAITRVLPIFKDIVAKLRLKLEISRAFRSYIELFMMRETEMLRCDFALDSPYRLGAKIFNKEYGIFIDNSLDISCNKLSALYDRNEAKDFVDIYFIDKEIMNFEKLVAEAKKKHIGLDNYWLAISLAKIEDVSILPKMLKPVSIKELQIFFKEKAHCLLNK